MEGAPKPEGDRKKALRREIRKWWEGVADHIDRIDQVLQSTEEPSLALTSSTSASPSSIATSPSSISTATATSASESGSASTITITATPTSPQRQSKALPRLPSTDEAYDMFEQEQEQGHEHHGEPSGA